MKNKIINIDQIFQIPKLSIKRSLLKIENFNIYHFKKNDLDNLNFILNIFKAICERTEQEITIGLNFKENFLGNTRNIIYFENLAYNFYSAALLSKHINSKSVIVSFNNLFGNNNQVIESEMDQIISVDLKMNYKSLKFNCEEEFKFIENKLDANENEKNLGFMKYKKVALGGSFDHMHLGHNLLLTTASLSCSENLYIGITSDEMILKKDSNLSTIQPYEEREENVRRILKIIGFNKTLEISKINDSLGNAAVDPTLEALILTEETKSGGEYLNKIRKTKNLPAIDLVFSPIIYDKTFNNISSHKLSSRETRKRIRTLSLNLDELLSKWQILSYQLNIDKDASLIWFSKLRDLYCQSWRKYHNLNHIFEMISLASNLPVYDTINFHLAIWFHDSIYVPTRNNNEERSIDLFNNFYDSTSINSQIVSKSKVIQYIMHTKFHSIDQLDVIQDLDLQYFLDVDIAIFSSAKYSNYVHSVREEFSDFNDDDWKKGRKVFLMKMLNRKRLFYSNYFYEKFETISRENISNEIIRF